MRYQIDHINATQTVKATQDLSTVLADALSDVKNVMDGAKGVLKHSPAVSGALEAVKEGAVEPAGETMQFKVLNATGSTSDALKTYAQGDQQMSANVCPVPGNIDMPG